MPRTTRTKRNTATQPLEDTDSDGYGSPAYLKWVKENDEWLEQQLNKDTPANKAALEIMRTLFGGKHEKHQNKN
jgi:hypothetical protein